MSTTRVMYVGLKSREVDNKKARTGIVWECHGDIKDVPDWAWKILSQYPDVWIDVPAEPGAVVDTGLSAMLPPPKVKQEVDDADLLAMTVKVMPAENAPAVEPVAPAAVESDSTPASMGIDLYSMSTAALRDYAVRKELRVDLALKGPALRSAIAEALKA